MVKKFLTYFLSVYLLLLSGYSQLVAQPYKKDIVFSQLQNDHTTVHAGLSKTSPEVVWIKSSGESQNFQFGAVDIEEDEFDSFKKKSKDLFCFTTILHFIQSGFSQSVIVTCIQERLSHFSSFGSLNLAFCVFRL